MDLTNMKNDNGFFSKNDLLLRMHRLRPSFGGCYRLRCLKNSSFVEVLLDDDNCETCICEIYCGNKDLFDYVKESFHEAANQLGRIAKSEEHHAYCQ